MVVLLLLAATQAAPPDIPLPRPTGSRGVGVATYTWTDSSRIDTMASPPSSRVVLGRVWYPARRVSGTPTAPYAPNLDGGVNEWTALHSRVRTNAQLRPPFDATPPRAPVIIFATGRTTGTFDYSTLGEDLASHGYIVIGVDSPHHSKVVQSDGTLAPIRFPSMPPSTYPNGIDTAQAPMNQLVSSDLRFVVGQLARLDRDDAVLRGHLDLARVGMAGHSNGAMAGSRACALESICRTFLGIEGQQTREVRQAGSDKPYGQIYSEQTLSFDTARVFTEIRLHARAPYTLYRVNGAGHNSFTDLLVVRPTMFSYPMPASRGVELTRVLVRGYFDRYLLGRADGDAAATSAPEVKVERYP